MDEKVTFKTQLEQDVRPVILLNKFIVKHEDVDEFLKVFSTTSKEHGVEYVILNNDESELWELDYDAGHAANVSEYVRQKLVL